MIEPSETKKILCAIISKMRFPLVFFVLIIHSKLSDVSCDSNNILNFSEWMFSNVLTRGTVMCYFFISGYLFFLKAPSFFEQKFFFSQIKKRWRTLIIPFILWNFIALLYLLTLESYLFPQIPNFGDSWSNFNIINKIRYLFIKPAMGPLWYLKELIFLSFTSPLIFFVLKKAKGLFPLTLIICWIIWGGSLKIFTLGGLTFFTLGAYIALYNINIHFLFTKKMKFLLLCSYLSLAIYEMLSGNIDIDHFYGSMEMRLSILINVIILLYIGQYFVNHSIKIFDKPLLTSSAFFIYCIHGEVTKGIVSSIGHSVCSFSWGWATYLVMPFILYGLWFSAYILLRHFFPKLLEILAGGRL